MSPSTISVPNDRFEGLLAEWALCSSYDKGIRDIVRRDTVHDQVGPRTDISATAIRKEVNFLTLFMSESKSQLRCLAWDLSRNEQSQWAQTLFLLSVRWLHSLETGEISRPLLSQMEVDELVGHRFYDLERAQSLYSVKGFQVVDNFLKQYPFLGQILIEAYGALRKFFPDNKLRLEHSNDPEVPDDEKLVLYVETRASVEEALRILDEFEEEWWLNNLERAENRLLIDVEFI